MHLFDCTDECTHMLAAPKAWATSRRARDEAAMPMVVDVATALTTAKRFGRDICVILVDEQEHKYMYK